MGDTKSGSVVLTGVLVAVLLVLLGTPASPGRHPLRDQQQRNGNRLVVLGHRAGEWQQCTGQHPLQYHELPRVYHRASQ
jgi:hypothetical protein